jgi:glutaminyl-peptide cyclotransferase
MKNYKYLLPLSIFLIACGPEKKQEAQAVTNRPEEKAAIPELEYTLGSTLPHDTTSFTEGLLFYNNELLESTGSPEGSSFKSGFGTVDLKTGKINVKAELDKEMYNPLKKVKEHVFGEGIVVLKNKIYQVTWQNQTGFIYDAKTFKKAGQFNYPNKEGWGMTTDSTSIIMSDGTEVLSFFDTDFRPVKTLSVKENGYAKDDLNELEFINGFIYANVWMTGDIVKIDPATGNVVARINLTPLSYEVKNFNPRSLEMNGIAYDAVSDKIYVTGKAWPKIYEVKFQH